MSPEHTTLLDIDGTMVDYNKIDALCFPQLIKCLATTPEKFYLADDRYMRSLPGVTEFNAEDYLVFLSEEFDTPYPVVESVFFDPVFYNQAIYPDVVGSLEELAHLSELGIYSQSYSRRYQEAKIRGIRQYFSERLVFIAANKLQNQLIDQLPQRAIIVDDTPAVVNSLHSTKRFSPIWINRDGSSVHPQIPTIRSLEELPEYLK